MIKGQKGQRSRDVKVKEKGQRSWSVKVKVVIFKKVFFLLYLVHMYSTNTISQVLMGPVLMNTVRSLQNPMNRLAVGSVWQSSYRLGQTIQYEIGVDLWGLPLNIDQFSGYMEALLP